MMKLHSYVFVPLFFISALIRVESGGRVDVIGKFGEVGPLQIRQCVVDDINRWMGTDLTLEHAKKPTIARWMCQVYLRRYCTKERLGREPTLQDAARIWNGGPDGWKEPETKKYWEKVKLHLNKQNGGDRIRRCTSQVVARRSWSVGCVNKPATTIGAEPMKLAA